MAEDKNTYSTYAVKLDGEVKEELQALLEGYKQETGTNAGDFIKTLLEVYKTNKIINKASGTDTDIKELNTLTSRIYSIYGNLIERNKSNNNNLQLEFMEQLAQKDNSINNLKVKLQELEQESGILKDAFNNSCNDKTKLEQELQQVKELNNSYKLNISKLQEDAKSLQELKEVNNKLLDDKEELNKLLADSQSRNIELDSSIKDKDSNIEKLKYNIAKIAEDKETSINELNSKHDADIETIKEKADIQREKELLKIKSEYQEEIQKEKDKYNTDTEKHNKEIEEYQRRYKELLQELEHTKNKPSAKKS